MGKKREDIAELANRVAVLEHRVAQLLSEVQYWREIEAERIQRAQERQNALSKITWKAVDHE